VLIAFVGPVMLVPSPVEAQDPEIVVGSPADVVDGDTSTIQALLSDPGPDGISLREAIIATNNEPGVRVVRFGPGLRGRTILLESSLPPLTGGGVTIDGDIDGDGSPDVTLAKAVTFERGICRDDERGCGVSVASSGNHLQSLVLVGFGTGVSIGDWEPTSGLPTPGRTFSDISVKGLVMRDIGGLGVQVGQVYNDQCGVYAGYAEPCQTSYRWADITISGNTLQAYAGIKVVISGAGDRVEDVTVADNHIEVRGGDAGISLNVANADGAIISDSVVAGNVIVGPASIGIDVNTVERSRNSRIQRVRVLDNELRLSAAGIDYCCQGINVHSGDETPQIHPNVLPWTWPDGNDVGHIEVRGNTVTGPLVWGISVFAGLSGGARNVVHDVRIEGNVLSSSTPSAGILIMTAGNSSAFGRTEPETNRVSGIAVVGNRISRGEAGGSTFADASIAVIGGWNTRSGSVTDVDIVNNVLGPPGTGVMILGGDEGTTDSQVADVDLVNNTILTGGAPSLRIVSNENPDTGTGGNTVAEVSALNDILWGPVSGEVRPSMVRTSVVQDPAFAGLNGNVSGDPLFVNAATGDLHLDVSSPAIGIGTADGAPATDLEGRTRPPDDVDAGAYQFTGPRAPATATGAPTAAQPTPTPDPEPLGSVPASVAPTDVPASTSPSRATATTAALRGSSPEAPTGATGPTPSAGQASVPLVVLTATLLAIGLSVLVLVARRRS